MARVHELLDEDRRFTCTMPVGISRTLLTALFNDKLGFRTLSARWVPKLLTDEHKRQRIEPVHAFLKLYDEEKYSVSDRIITGDEPWVHYFTPECKKASMQ